MAQTQKRKPIKEKAATPRRFADLSPEEQQALREQFRQERLDAMKTEQGEYGPIRVAEYTVGKHVFRMREIDGGQGEQVTALLTSRGAEGLTSFNDVGSMGETAFLATLTRSISCPEFLQIVLRENGLEVEREVFTAMPNEKLIDLTNEVVADFFFLNPLSMQRFMLFSGAVREEAGH